jgi:hypothetical protein
MLRLAGIERKREEEIIDDSLSKQQTSQYKDLLKRVRNMHNRGSHGIGNSF